MVWCDGVVWWGGVVGWCGGVVWGGGVVGCECDVRWDLFARARRVLCQQIDLRITQPMLMYQWWGAGCR
jgi:hypothetical protein